MDLTAPCTRLLCALTLLGLISGCSLFNSSSDPASTPPTSSTSSPSEAGPSEIGSSGTSSSSQSSESGSATPSPSIAVRPNSAPPSPSTSPSPTSDTPANLAKDTKVNKETPNPSNGPKDIDTKDKTLISNLKQEIEEKTPVLKENSGKINLSRLLVAQKAQKLVSGSFTSDLTTLDAGVPAETNHYRFVIESSSPDKTTLSAIAKTAKLPSYSAAAYAVAESLPVSIICQTKSASKTPPSPPTYEAGKLVCPANSVLAEG